MRRLAATTAILAALALAACGGDDETTTTTTTSGTSGASGASGETGSTTGSDMTAGEFIDASLPDEIKAVEDIVATNPDACGNVDPKPGEDFQVSVAVNAAQASPDTPLEDVVLDECESAG